MTEDRLLREILDALPLPVLEIGPDGTTLQGTAYFPKNWNTGQPPRTLMDIVHPDERLSIQDALQTLPRTGSISLEVRVKWEPSKEGWGLLALSCNDTDGRRLILAQITDITRQKLREHEIAQKESRWNSALTSSLSGVWDQNFVTGEMYGSEIWRAIRGITPDEPIENNSEQWLKLVHPDDQQRVLHSIERQNAGDPAYTVFEYREKHKQGHWIWIECRGACVERDDNGRPVRIVGTDTDISGRKAAEETMNRISQRLKLALEASQIGVFEVDFETGITTWDNRMYAMFGVEKKEQILVGGIWETLVHPEDLPRVEEKVNAHIEALKPFSEDYRIIRPDGGQRFIRARTVPFIDADGRKKMVGVNWDVTADVTLHRELERAKMLAEARNSELEAARSSIEHNAMHDYLTDLPNRRYLDDTLVRLAAERGRDGSGIGILHIDLDRFKQINDTLGHRTGDMMLKHVAELLRKNIRDGDFVARIGGDEFVFVSRFNGNPRKFSALATRLIKQLRKPVQYEGHECRFGASIGIAWDNGANMDTKQILLNADIALYNAKKRGRNRFEFFSSDTQDLLINTKRVSDEILLALERDEFVPYYQLQFDARTLDISGVETLARWQHPQEGLLTPDRFLAIAEDLDAVASIDALIFEKAMADFRIWQRKELPIPKFSVNVSSRRLHDPLLTKTLDGLDIEPGTVSFELLESIFLDDSDETVMSNLARLRKLGIDIEIDDFGTGHASIISLLRVSPSTLKVDRELVRLLPQSLEQRKLLSSIIDIGRSLNIKVVAEGVETWEHIRILRDMGCDSLQGYALCRPLPSEKIEAFVQAQSWRISDIEKPRPARSKPALERVSNKT